MELRRRARVSPASEEYLARLRLSPEERRMVLERVGSEGGGEDAASPNPLILQGVEAGCDPMRSSEGSSPSRTRTYNKPVNSRLLYH